MSTSSPPPAEDESPPPPPAEAEKEAEVPSALSGEEEQDDSHSEATNEHHTPFFADATLDLEDAHDIADDHDDISAPHPLAILPSTATATAALPPPAAPTSQIPTIEMTNTKTIPTSSANMARISSNPPPVSPLPSHRPRPPRKPRDIPYALTFILVMIISLTYPHIRKSTSAATIASNNDSLNEMAQSSVTSLTTFISLACCIPICLLIGRTLYKTPGGGDGDDFRHLLANCVESSTIVSVMAFPLMIIAIYLHTPSAWPFAVLPLMAFLRDVLVFREWFSGRAGGGGGGGGGVGEEVSSSGPWGALRDEGRRTFWKELMSMSLDILSRSFRRAVFTRLVLVVVGLQGVFVYLCQSAFLASLVNKRWFVFVVGAAYQWGSGFLMSLLGLVCAGGITSWFAKEGMLMEEFEAGRTKNSREGGDDTDSFGQEVYSSVRDYDEGMEDEYPEEEGGIDGTPSNRRNGWGSAGTTGVKSFLVMGLTVSFGSVAQCGLTGALAQMLWGAMRNIDDVDVSGGRRGFTEMSIGTHRRKLDHLMVVLRTKIREFISNNSDLALSHVAAYFKGYTRASNDVMALIDNTGVEPIIHDDVSTPILSAATAALSSIITLFCFYVLTQSSLSDYAICEVALLVYVMSYTVFFTVLEPLRASIKAVYICFAQNPQSLRHAFPLIFHRLSRISESGMMD